MSVFSMGPQVGQGGWGDLVGGIANLGFSYALSKQQAKAQRRLMRSMNRGFGSGGTYQGFPINTFAGNPAVSFAPTVAAPAAAAGLPAWATLGAGAAAAGGALGLLPELGDMLPGGLEEGGTGIFGPDLFRPTAASSRQRMIDAPHPQTGERVFWRPVGKPILFSGDLALLKRTRKTIGRFVTPLGIRRAAGRFRRRRC